MRLHLAIALILTVALASLLGGLVLRHVLYDRFIEAQDNRLAAVAESSVRNIETALNSGLAIDHRQLQRRALEPAAAGLASGEISLSIVNLRGQVIASNRPTEVNRMAPSRWFEASASDMRIQQKAVRSAFGTGLATVIARIDAVSFRLELDKLNLRVMAVSSAVFLMMSALAGLLAWLLPLSAIAQSEQVARRLAALYELVGGRDKEGDEFGTDRSEDETPEALREFGEKVRSIDSRLRLEATQIRVLDEQA